MSQVAAVTQVGVVHGRFQPLHLGHMEYLLAAAARCAVLVVGITNPDPDQTIDEPSAPERGLPQANPCTYYERYLMIEGALADAGQPPDRLRIVPFPHSRPELLRYYAPTEAVYFLTIYDTWGEVKLQRFASLGLSTEVLWRRTDKPISGSRVRAEIASSGPWQELLPAAVARVIEENGIVDRIRRASA